MDPVREPDGVANGLRLEACDPGLLNGILKTPVAGGAAGLLRYEAGDVGLVVAP